MILNPKQLSRIQEICESRCVAGLYLFGSAATEAFCDASDYDFAVVFADSDVSVINGRFDRYMGLVSDLEKLLGRKVDLVSLNSIRNPYFKEEVEKTMTPVFTLNAA